MNYESVGERIKKYRQERELTQERLAELCDLSTNFISIIECGKKRPSLDTFAKIANALNVSADMLLEDELEDYSYGTPLAAETQSPSKEGRRFVHDLAERAAQFVKEVEGNRGIDYSKNLHLSSEEID